MPAHMKQIVTSDIGGTHARFALATLEGGRVTELRNRVTLKTDEHESFEAALVEFQRRSGAGYADLAISFAGPVGHDKLKLTNNAWVISPATLGQELGVDRCTIVNDFGAVAHAVACLSEEQFLRLSGPRSPLPADGIISIVGPGTGLGVAILSRNADRYEVIETEAGHVDFAPIDGAEDRILMELRGQFGRVSVERIASGPGLWNLYQVLGSINGRPLTLSSEQEVWDAALAGTDELALAALDRFCSVLGSFAGDCALSQGAAAVVIAGGIGLRIADYLPKSGFRDRFVAKGRFEGRMATIPVKIVAYPEPGLLGAAAAFARDHC